MAPRPRPEPLTPADCDLRNLPYMPLHGRRLQHSRTWNRAAMHPEIGFYLMNLWVTSWHEVPAASLEDDDAILCRAAMCEFGRWQVVRSAVMESFVLCADGRFYHPVVAEIANETWLKNQTMRERLKNIRELKAQKTAEKAGSCSVTGSDTALNYITSKKEKDSLRESKKKVAGDLFESPFAEPGEPSPDAPQGGALPIKPDPRGTRLDPAWRPSAQLAAYCRERGVDPDLAAEEFLNYWTALPGARARKLSWDNTFRNSVQKLVGDRRYAFGAGDIGKAPEPPSASRQQAGGPKKTPEAWDDPHLWFHLCDKVSVWPDDGLEHGEVNGNYLDIAAREIAAAAKLPWSYNQWEPLIRWLNDGFSAQTHIIPTILEIASKPGYKAPSTLSYFDKAVRRYSTEYVYPKGTWENSPDKPLN